MEKIYDYIYFALMGFAIIANVLSVILTARLKKTGVKVPAKLENLMKLFDTTNNFNFIESIKYK